MEKSRQVMYQHVAHSGMLAMQNPANRKGKQEVQGRLKCPTGSSVKKKKTDGR